MKTNKPREITLGFDPGMRLVPRTPEYRKAMERRALLVHLVILGLSAMLIIVMQFYN